MQPSFKSANMQYPLEGAKMLEWPVMLSGAGVYTETDLFEELANNQISQIQSVFIDNSLNAASFRITFKALQTPGYTVNVPAYWQGWWPVAVPAGNVVFRATGTAGATVPVILSNVPMPYIAHGPQDGALTVPALETLALNFTPLVVGNNIIVPAGVGLTPRLYRLLLVVDNPVIVRFRDGAAGAYLSGSIPLFAGGAIEMQASGVAWFTGTAGNEIMLEADTAVNAGGMSGYTLN